MSNHVLMSGGVERRYRLLVPSPLQHGTSLPVVVAFHGYTGNPEGLIEYTGLEDGGVARGAAVITPSGFGTPPRWAAPPGLMDGPDDLEFIDAVMAHAAKQCVVPSRLVVAGHSNGAAFSVRLACRWGSKIVGFVAVGGANMGPRCPGRAAVRTVVFHGDADDVVPLNGGPVIGGLLQAIPMAEWVEGWTQDGRGAAVDLTVLPGWGHGWPAMATPAVLAMAAP